MSYHNAQVGTYYVVYNLLEQVVMERLSRDTIGETWNAHIAKPFNTFAAADRLSRRVPTSRWFMAMVTMFLPRRMDSAIADLNTVLTKTSKKDPVAVAEASSDASEALQSLPHSGNEEPQCCRSSRHQSESHHSKREDRRAKQLWLSSKSLEKNKTGNHKQERTMRWYWRINNTIVVVQQKTKVPKMIHRLTSVESTDVLVSQTYWSFAMSMIASKNR